MKTEITLAFVDNTGKRFPQGNFRNLTEAHKEAEKCGIKEQVTYEETEGQFHAHLMEFRDDEHYNDIYLK